MKTTKYQRGYGLGNYRGLRFAVLTMLGGKCARCPQRNLRVLQVDHVKEDGKRHRDQLKTKGGITLMTAVLQEIAKGHSARFQVLCANCHMIKSQERYAA